MKPVKQYMLRMPDEVAALVRNLHPQIKSSIKFALKMILEDPFCGKSLKEELKGLKSYRVKRYRIIYRISRDGIIEVVTIGPRRHIYEDTFRIISQQKEAKSEGIK